MTFEDTKLEQAYHLLFEKYKKDIEYLGIPISEYSERELIEMFDRHLDNISKVKA